MTGKSKRSSWAQPSLSRDFVLLSAAIVAAMVVISAWVAWVTQAKHMQQTQAALAQEAGRIERALDIAFDDTGYLLEAVGRQISRTTGGDTRTIATLLKAYDVRKTRYAVWTWTDATSHIVASTAKGVLEEPVNVADRDYVVQAQAAPWRVHVGMPVEGRVSERWIIPIAIGVADITGKYLGTLEASLDIATLTDTISQLVKQDGMSFAIVSKDFAPLAAVADSEEFVVSQLPLENLSRIDPEKGGEGMLSRTSPLAPGGMHTYYRVSANYPYIIVVSYGSRASENAIRALLWPRLIQIAIVAAFLLSLLWIIRSRVIKPVMLLSDIAGEVAGGAYRIPGKTGPQEIEALALQLGRISDYIVERRRVEDELRNKLSQMLRRLERAQNDMRARAALLAGMLAEYKQALQQINGHAQVLKDQLYGPIENKKYAQYASDIHQAGTALELMVRKLIALSRVDAGLPMRKETVLLPALWEQARRFAAETPGAGGLAALELEAGGLPALSLSADMMHAQQGLAYALLYAAGERQEALRAVLRRARDGERAVLLIGPAGAQEPGADALSAGETRPSPEDLAPAMMHYTLAEALLESQGMALSRHGAWLAVDIPPSLIPEAEQEAEE